MNNQYISTNALIGDYIAHFRTKGSKNGVRLYQNKDGTYTELGKERRRKGDKAGKYFERDKQGKSPAESVAGHISTISRETGNIGRTFSSKKVNRKDDAKIKHMSDAELRDRVNRLNLEKQYRYLTAEDTARGRITAGDVLSVAGSITTIGASGVAIYATLKNLKG